MIVHILSPGFTGFGGGITAFSRELALGLHGLGHDVRLIGKADTPGFWRAFPLLGVGAFHQSLQNPTFALIALAACARHRPNHIISSHVNFGPVARWANRIFGISFTLVAHGIDVHTDLSLSRRAGLREANRVIAVSSWTRQRVLQIDGVNAARVVVLANTFDEERFTVPSRPKHLAERYKLRADERVILCVARLDPTEGYKGYDRIVQALPAIQSACGPVRFLLAGKGNDRDRVEALAHSLGVSNAVTFTGFLPDDELVDHYRLRGRGVSRFS